MAPDYFLQIIVVKDTMIVPCDANNYFKPTVFIRLYLGDVNTLHLINICSQLHILLAFDSFLTCTICVYLNYTTN